MNLKNGFDQNLLLITNLIGKICFNKYEDIYWSRIGNRILINSKDDLIWRKIGRRLMKQQDNTFHLENLIRPLLLNADNYDQIEWYLGEQLIKESDQAILHLLTNKFILLKHFPVDNQNLVENLIGYLIHYNLESFEEMLYNLLTVWSNSTLVRHQINDQHFYLCRILICSLKHMIELQFKLDQKKHLSVILHAAETHLKMVELEKRNTGLFVVEKLINYLNKQNIKLEDKLNFEIDPNDKNVQVLIKIFEGDSNKSKKATVDRQEEKIKPFDNHKLDLEYIEPKDIDDDLIPYEITNDKPLIKRPIYLKDCLEGLMNTEDLEWNHICLESLPELIDKNRSQSKELAIDFIRTLIFLENEDEELKSIKFKSMVKFCNLNPLNSAKYLTDRIYDQNLTIIRKLEVLDVIVESAKQLSSLENGSLSGETTIRSIQNIVRQQPKKEWERIIEERVKSKTKVLCSSAKLPLSSRNEFMNCVGHFFYPLINNYDKKEITLKFNEDDYFVLGRIILTLAELIKSVSQTHVTRKMAISLIEFLNVFKYHPESYVRKSITFCIHSILTNVPNYFLFEDLQAELFGLRDFLISLKQSDPETFHSHGVLVLYTLEEQLNDYKNRLKMTEKMQKIKIK